MEQNIYVANNLLRVYITCGKLQEACQLFDKLENKSVVTWNIMIGGYAQHKTEDAVETFNQMRQLGGAQPNEITDLSVLQACANPSALKWGTELHAHIKHNGFGSAVRIGTALLKMYAKCGSIKHATQVWQF